MPLKIFLVLLIDEEMFLSFIHIMLRHVCRLPFSHCGVSSGVTCGFLRRTRGDKGDMSPLTGDQIKCASGRITDFFGFGWFGHFNVGILCVAP